MAITSLTLGNFLHLVPVCSQQTDLIELLANLCSPQINELIVVVNSAQFPLGTISPAGLLSYLLEKPINKRDGQGNPITLSKQILAYFPTCFDINYFLQPISIVSEKTSLEKFYHQIKNNPDKFSTEQHYALVNSQEKFLGLLDWYTLSLALLSSSQDSSLHSLLEKIDAPLLLETDGGQVLYRNCSWWKNIGYLPSEKIHNTPLDEGKACLHFVKNTAQIPPHCLPNPVEPLPVLVGINPDANVYVALQNIETTQIPKHVSVAVSETINLLGINPENWQFTKIPLNLTEEGKLSLTVANQIEAKTDLFSPFPEDLFTAIAHELKSPLTAIVGLSSLLKEEKLGELNQRQTRYAELIHRSGKKLIDLVNDLIDLTRLETGKLKLDWEKIHIATVCQQAYEQIETISGIEIPSLNLSIAPELEIIVADRLHLRQILRHVLDYTVKFISKEGKIHLKVNTLGKWIAFTFQDREEGTFASFTASTLENNSVTAMDSLGWGLTVAKKLARACGGDLFLGVDNQVTFLLPARDFPVFPTQGMPRINNLVLVAESRSYYAEDLTAKLEKLGYRVAKAQTGIEALAKARQLNPSTILLNPHLPLLSGVDVFTLLNSDKATQSIRVVALIEEKAVKEKTLSGAKAHLSLPIDLMALKEIMPPLLGKVPQPKKLCVLRLYPEGQERLCNPSSLDIAINNYLAHLNHRIVEADSLEQAEILARIWKLDLVLLEGISHPLNYLRSLSQYDFLASLPLVTLDTQTTESANQIPGLTVFPYLLPLREENLNELVQVMQIATE